MVSCEPQRLVASRPVRLQVLWPHAVFPEGHPIDLAAATADSRRVQPGDAFVAIRGRRTDGHRHLAEAIARGAAAVIVEGEPVPAGAPRCAVPDTRVAWGELCQALAGNPAARLRIIGITGTTGKTTTSLLVRSVLQEAGSQVGLIGTLGWTSGPGSSMPRPPAARSPALTTPEPPQLAVLLARMVQAGCSHVVIEASSQGLDQHRLAGVPLDTAVFTNLGRDHFDDHGSVAAYRAAKGRIFDRLGPGGVAVLNADDSASEAFRPRIAQPIMTYGLGSPADVTGRINRLSARGSGFDVHLPAGRVPVWSRLLGGHNVSNALAAAAVGAGHGAPPAAIARGIERIETVPGRLERIDAGQPFDVLVDYAHTPEGLARVLGAISGFTRGRVFCVFGAGGDRDRGKRPRMGRAVEAAADRVIVTTDNPRSEDPERIARAIVGGFADPRAAIVDLDRRRAIHRALRWAAPGDCVLIAGKGHETVQVWAGRTVELDDRIIARDCLEQLGHGRPGEPLAA